MLELSKKQYLAKGTNRACYLHPNDETKCIKITISNDFSESKKEINYYKYLKNRDISWKYISRYYEDIETSLGQGSTYDLIRDYTGKVSKTLSFYLQKDELTKEIENPVVLLEKLKEYCKEELIFTKDLNTKNMLLQKTSETSTCLILIDGVSPDSLFIFTKFFNFFIKRKINFLWKNFENSLYLKYAFNKYFIKLLKS